MGKKVSRLIAICLGVLTISGCWDYRDINKINFLSTAAYDLHEGGTGLTAQGEAEPTVDLTTIIPNVSEDARSPFRIETSSGLMVGTARGQIAYVSPGIYTPGVVQVVVMGEELASIGINNIFEAIFRGAQFPRTPNLAIAEGRGEQILRLPTRDYPSMGSNLRGLLRNSDKRAFIPAVTFFDFGISRSPGKNPVMPLLGIRDKKVEVIGSAIFDKDRMVGRADLDETRSLMMLRGMKATGIVSYIIQKDGQTLDQGSVDLKNSRKVEVKRNGDEFTFRITINLKGYLVEHQFGKLFTENKDLRKMIEDQIAADATQDCNKFIQKMQREYQVDCIDISKYALAKWRKELTDKVDQDFIEHVNIKVEVIMKLQNVGELT